MDISTEDFSKAPYFDDQKSTQNRVKVLFKPGIPVQARELNELQSAIQAQISTVGSHLFKNGSMVIPGTPKLNQGAAYIIVEKLISDTTMESRIVGKLLTEEITDAIIDDNNTVANVENFIDLGNYGVVIVSYQKFGVFSDAGTVKNYYAFNVNANLSIEDSTETLDVISAPVMIEGELVNHGGAATTLSVDAGVYYVDGYFVHTPVQKIVVAYSDPRVNKKAGFVVNKSIVTAFDDVTLFDNATGSENEGAPGADRYQIDLVLDVVELDYDGNFIELIRLENGNLRTANINPQYNVIMDTLARRTYDESGDYAVWGLSPTVIEHLSQDGSPSGFMSAAEGGDDNKFVVQLDQGKGYVKGYEVENLSNYFIQVDKARTPECEKVANDVIQINEHGSFIYLAPGNQFFDISKHPIIWLTTGVESTAPIMGYCIPKYMDAVNISGQTIFQLYGSFHLNSSSTFGWQDIGGWRLSQLKNGPVLQVLKLSNVNGNFSVVDGLPLSSHTGYTPYAWDTNNKNLYIKKTMGAPVFNREIAVVKGTANGFVTNIVYNVQGNLGAGELFKLSHSNIKTIKDDIGNVEIQSDIAFQVAVVTNGSGYAEYNLLGDGVFVGTPVAASTMNDNAYFNNIVSIQNSGKRLVINNGSFLNHPFSISAIVRKPISIKSKALAEGSTLIPVPTNRTMILKHKDIYKIKNIYVSDDLVTAPTVDDTDITTFYQLVNLDSLDFYNNTGLKSNAGFAVPQGQMLVVYDYFIHGAGDAFSVDSYVSLRDNVANEDDTTHIGRIPMFKTVDQGYLLGDHLDFRKTPRDGFFIIKGSFTNGSPDVLITEDYTNVIAAGAKIFSQGFETVATTVSAVTSTKLTLSGNSNFTGSSYFVVNVNAAVSAAEPFAASELSWSAIANSTVTYDATYFVDRWDRVVISKMGEIRYLYGTPGVNSYPNVPMDAMGLVKLVVPAYTRKASTIVYKKDENKRFTMRDIGRLEDRIENLEYYTTLTLKELETKDMKILDTDGFDRFKSGLFVSNFRDFGVFNPLDDTKEFDLTLVASEEKLIPKEYADHADMVFDPTNSTNFTIIGDRIFMPYTEVVEVEQPFATKFETLNPYMIINWDTELVLNPNSDTWIETEWKPTLTNENTIVNNTFSFETVNNSSTLSITAVSAFREVNTVSSSTSRTTSNSGTRVSSNSRLVGSSVIPLIRPREIFVKMTGAKPTTRFWARFDNQGVSQYCCPYNPDTQVRGTFGEALISNPMGTVNAIFAIPPATFNTGERVFELSDVDLINDPDSLMHCNGNATYIANGTLEIMQQVVDVLHTINNHTHTVITNNTTITIGIPNPPPPPEIPFFNPWQGGGDVTDPLAQTFFTAEIDGPGYYATKIDLYFAKKDKTIPVWLEMKEVVNGQPARNRIPGSLVIMSPTDTNLSNDSTVATTFTFTEPLYLQSNREYCFVVGSASSRYAVWMTKLGEKIINEERVLGEQPSLGTLMKSQNNATWTPFQLEDLKFRLHRARFDAGQSTSLTFNSDGTGAKRRLIVSKFFTTSGSKIIKVYHPNHGTQVNEYVRFEAETAIGRETDSPSGVTSYNGIAFSNIYGSRLVKAVYSINEYGIEVAVPATVTGFFENYGQYVFAYSNMNFNEYRIAFDEFLPDGTLVNYETSLITGRDFDGGQTPQVVFPVANVKNRETVVLPDVGLYQIQENESTSKSMSVTINGTTKFSSVCPVIHLKKNGVTMSSLALNKPDISSENLPTGGNCNSKAGTRTIRLKTLSNSIRVYTAENKQEKNAIEVWFRSSANRNLDEINWQLLLPVAETVQNDLDTYIEHERILEDIVPFDEYQLKICFKGSNSTRYPSLKELNCITVAS